MILHIPHASDNIPFADGFIDDDKIIQAEIVKLTDWHTQELFHSANDNMIVADFSRIFCDPERFADDEQEIMSKVGMGVLYERTDDGMLLRSLTSDLREKILSEYYWPHHAKLNEAVEKELSLFGTALILDCHSFSNTPFKRDLVQKADRPDFNIGTDAFHTSEDLINTSVKYFEARGFTLGLDWPYQGTIVPMGYYGKDKNVQSIMLEVNRSLYLKDETNQKNEQFEETKAVVQGYMRMITKEFSRLALVCTMTAQQL